MSNEKTKKKIVYTSIVGDLLHVGHLNLLRKAKALGDFLIVGVITDEAAQDYKRKPIISFKDRMELIKSLDCVNQVVPQHTRDGTENLKKLQVDILVRGNDAILHDEVAYIKSIGGKFVQIPYTNRISTTKIIDTIKRLDMQRKTKDLIF